MTKKLGSCFEGGKTAPTLYYGTYSLVVECPYCKRKVEIPYLGEHQCECGIYFVSCLRLYSGKASEKIFLSPSYVTTADIFITGEIVNG